MIGNDGKKIYNSIQRRYGEYVWLDITCTIEFNAKKFSEVYKGEVVIVDDLCRRVTPGHHGNIYVLRMSDWARRGWTFQEAAYANHVAVWSDIHGGVVDIEDWIGLDTMLKNSNPMLLWLKTLEEWKGDKRPSVAFVELSKRWWRYDNDLYRCYASMFSKNAYSLDELLSLKVAVEILCVAGNPGAKDDESFKPITSILLTQKPARIRPQMLIMENKTIKVKGLIKPLGNFRSARQGILLQGKKVTTHIIDIQLEEYYMVAPPWIAGTGDALVFICGKNNSEKEVYSWVGVGFIDVGSLFPDQFGKLEYILIK